jgi:predicted anti-sigma-YlaC factor YlaD
MSEPTTGADDGELHDGILADYDDYQAGALPAARKAEIDLHLASCSACKTAYADLAGAVSALGGLGKKRAPELPGRVTETINRRSGGRFFGPRAFGDRVPFVLIAVIGLLLAAAAVWLARSSDTGSVERPRKATPERPKGPPGSVVPRPLP